MVNLQGCLESLKTKQIRFQLDVPITGTGAPR